MSAQILIVDDEAAIRQMLAFTLAGDGHTCLEAGDAEEAQQTMASRRPDLLLLDWMLPDSPGVDIARRLRRDARTRELPILMLTARAHEGDKLAGFEAGVDDYVTKPFSPRELIARVRAMLRRTARPEADEALEIAGLRLDPATFRVSARGEPVELSPTEYRLLLFLMSRPDRVHSRARLLDAVWGDRADIEERTVDVHIRRLRVALQPTGFDRLIETVRGGGYRLLPS
jgi:two-component system phosphate regulon response regulator PhoB